MRMDLGLRNRVAIVTGSSRGLGKATAMAFAQEGVRVVLNARTESSLQAAAEEIRSAGGTVEPIAADVTTESGCADLVDGAIRAFGQVDILVNNAGGSSRARLASPDSEWSATVDWMFWPSLRLSRMVAPGMRERRWGAIVMISSIYGREQGSSASYQVTKSAQLSLSKALARELAPDNVLVRVFYGQTLALVGNRDSAVAVARELEAMEPRQPAPNVMIARLYAILGDTTHALAALERGREANEAQLSQLRAPGFESLNGVPRFEQMLKEFKLK